jgi:hypothetical protein
MCITGVHTVRLVVIIPLAKTDSSIMRNCGRMQQIALLVSMFLASSLASARGGGYSRGQRNRSLFGGRFYSAACNRTCANGALPAYSTNWCCTCADGSLPLCACANGARPTCADGSAPRRSLPCADGSTPACAACSVLISRDHRGGKGRALRCSNGAQPLCQNGAVPVYARPCASNGGGPICADGSYRLYYPW